MARNLNEIVRSRIRLLVTLVCLMSWLASAEKRGEGQPGEGQVDIYVHLAEEKLVDVAVSDVWCGYTIKKVCGFPVPAGDGKTQYPFFTV
jgi:hypothetical protein